VDNAIGCIMASYLKNYELSETYFRSAMDKKSANGQRFLIHFFCSFLMKMEVFFKLDNALSHFALQHCPGSVVVSENVHGIKSLFDRFAIL
jgi:hypothetical protein